jgi:hypothetical protein
VLTISIQNDIVPTVGFVCEKFETGGLEFTAWDFSGQGLFLKYHQESETKASKIVLEVFHRNVLFKVEIL